MTGSLRSQWEFTPDEIWERLAAHEQAPLSLFADLFITVDDYLALRTPVARFGEISNDTAKAHDEFCGLKGIDFANETAIADFLPAAYEVISDYGIPGYDEHLKLLLRQFLRKYNLRYRLDDPFKLCFLLPGSFSNLYAEIQRLTAKDKHLSGLTRDFEHAFTEYARSTDPTDLKTCIHKANNLAEGLASNTMKYPANNTLGALCDQIKTWPHDKVKESLKNLYHFSSDFVGVRHAGRPNSCNRDLDQKDCVLTCLLLLTFSGYLTPGVDAQEILGSWPGAGLKRAKVFLPTAKPLFALSWPRKAKQWLSRFMPST